MDVFVGNLPEGIGPGEIEALFRPYGRQVSFRVARARLGNGAIRRFAHGVVHPERGARRAVARLNGRRLQGKTLLVRLYQHRAYGNERRDLAWRKRPWPWAERRQGERRHHREASPAGTPAGPPVDSPWYDGWFDMELEELDILHVDAYASFAIKHLP